MPRLHEHEVVSELPKDAMRVSEYAKQRSIHHSLVYHELKRGKAKFRIVVWKGINWVVEE